MQVQLPHDILSVAFYGLGADDQCLSDLVVAITLSKIGQYLVFAIG
jgi:hypothetical protein